jgi:rubrerythrin
MRFKKSREVLEHVKRFHEDISAYCERVCGASDEQRSRILLNYIADRERNLAHAVGAITEETSDQVLDTWFQYTTDDTALHALLTSSFRPTMSPEEVMSATLAIADHLLAMYRDMLAAADTDELRRVFQNLLDHEQKEKEKLARNLQMFQDL